MKTLLRIDCSSRTEGSYSRTLADHFERVWREVNTGGKVIYRDLVKYPLPHIHSDTIVAFHTPAGERSPSAAVAVKLSDKLIGELKSADELVISSPLYNLNIPSSLKAYIDQITRSGHTFGLGENGYYGLLNDKKACLITAKGSEYKGTAMEPLDFQEPYLKAILNFIGIEVQKVFSWEGTGIESTVAKRRESLEREIENYFMTAATKEVRS